MDPDLQSVLVGLASKNGWNQKEISVCSRASADQYYDVFKSIEGKEFRSALAGALTFKDVGNLTEEMKVINENVFTALRKISLESPLNAKRVKNLNLPAVVERPTQIAE